MFHLIFSNSIEYDADEGQPWRANGPDRLKFLFYFWFNQGRCVAIVNAGKNRKNRDVRGLIYGAGSDAIDIFKYKLCAEEPLALAPVEPMIRCAAGSNFRS
jgi:hypothetical protein